MHAYTFPLVIESKETRKIRKEWYIYQVMEHSWLKIFSTKFYPKKLSHANIFAGQNSYMASDSLHECLLGF